jgi:hypothetical protein
MRKRALLSIALYLVLGVVPVAVAGSAARPRVAPATADAANAPVYSTASNAVVQRQPSPGSCHALGSGPYARPDPHCTPGTLNPAVRQANIEQTICRSGWTATVRPPERITEAEKRLSLRAYGDRRPIWDYEYDHFVPLELGGATNDRRNLWPEPGASPNPKDRVENYLNRQVCDHQMTLARAQAAIVADWVAIYRHQHTSSNPGPGAARCNASAAWSSEYNDYDVYIRSNQPDTNATVTGAGTSASWYTNSSGYADVYFHARRSAAGDRVTVRVGTATCYTTL